MAGRVENGFAGRTRGRGTDLNPPNRFESFCYALHETRQAGVPVIANDIPAFREFLVHEDSALLCDGGVPALADAMEFRDSVDPIDQHSPTRLANSGKRALTIEDFAVSAAEPFPSADSSPSCAGTSALAKGGSSRIPDFGGAADR